MAETDRPLKRFTVSQANAMLPLVSAIVRDLVDLSKEVSDRRQRLEAVFPGRELHAGDPYDEEVVQVEQDLRADAERLHGFVAELRELGVEPKGPLEGLVDFPSELDGRVVNLCWKIGEAEVLFWHERDAGFADRQPLTPAPVADLDS